MVGKSVLKLSKTDVVRSYGHLSYALPPAVMGLKRHLQQQVQPMQITEKQNYSVVLLFPGKDTEKEKARAQRRQSRFQNLVANMWLSSNKSQEKEEG